MVVVVALHWRSQQLITGHVPFDKRHINCDYFMFVPFGILTKYSTSICNFDADTLRCDSVSIGQGRQQEEEWQWLEERYRYRFLKIDK